MGTTTQVSKRGFVIRVRIGLGTTQVSKRGFVIRVRIGLGTTQVSKRDLGTNHNLC